jgi:hypothetical protein
VAAIPGTASAAGIASAPTIGPVTVTSAATLDLTLDAPGATHGAFSFDALPGASVMLTANAVSMGAIAVGSLGSAVANLTLKAQVPTLGSIAVDGNLDLQGSATRTLGNVTVGGNATLVTAALTTLGNLGVGGALSLVGGLPALTQAGSFTVGSLPGLSKSMAIGSRAVRGSSIGAVSIGSVTRTKQQKGTYDFAFSTWQGTPSAVVAGRGVNASRNGAAYAGIKLFLTPGGVAPSSGQPNKKKSS